LSFNLYKIKGHRYLFEDSEK